MQAFETLDATFAIIGQDNIDTDQIIPARFLKATIRDGLGQHLFANWRYDGDEERADFVLNTSEGKAASILVTGANFGCGSSREHAPWALVDFGFRAVLSTSFADIFRANALKNGLLTVQVSKTLQRHLVDNPEQRIRIDLLQQKIITEDGIFETFDIDPFAKQCLLRGLDEMSFLLDHTGNIQRYEDTQR